MFSTVAKEKVRDKLITNLRPLRTDCFSLIFLLASRGQSYTSERLYSQQCSELSWVRAWLQISQISRQNLTTFHLPIFQGPSGFNVFRPRDWGNSSDKVTNGITLEVTRIALALGVFAIGVGESYHELTTETQ